jgi:hypothetical protein
MTTGYVEWLEQFDDDIVMTCRLHKFEATRYWKRNHPGLTDEEALEEFKQVFRAMEVIDAKEEAKCLDT